MIVETGRVTEIVEGKAVIAVEKGTACSACHAGCACDVGKSVRIIEANDPLGVHVNQCVQLAIPNESVLQAAFVVYVIPLLALIVGTLLGQYVGTRAGIENLFEVVGGFACLGLSLIFVKYYNNLFKQNLKNQPVITKIVG